MTSTVYS